MTASIHTFAAKALSYCDWIEGELHDVLTSRKLLLSLVQGIAELEFGADIEPDPPAQLLTVPHEYAPIVERISDFPFREYLQAFDPFDHKDGELTRQNVIDDLADVYRDLRTGRQLLDHGFPEAAAFHWLDTYSCQWGHHAVSALGAIDAYCRDRQLF